MIPEKFRGLVANKAAEQRYVSALRAIAKQVAAGVTKALARHFRDPGDTAVRHDAYRPNLGRVAAHSPTLDVLGVTVQTHIKVEVGKAFDKMSTAVDKTNKAAIKSLVGIPMSGTSVAPLIEQFREKNIQLMVDAGGDYLAQVRAVLQDTDGMHVEDIAAALQERAGVAGSRAELVARDQSLKLNANLSQQRMKNAGSTKYTWSTSHDERVRPMHADLEGTEHSWDDPPVTNDAGETNHPGEDIQCRCIALPVFTDFDDL